MAMPEPPENTFVVFLAKNAVFVSERIGGLWVNRTDDSQEPEPWEDILKYAEQYDANLHVLNGPPVTFQTVDRLKDGASYRAVYEGTWNSAYGTLDIKKTEHPSGGGWIEDHDVALAKYMYEI